MSAEVIGGDGRIKDRQGVPPQGIAFRGQRTTDIGPLAAGWNGPFGFDEVFDTAQAYTGSRFVAPVPGYYEFSTIYSGSGFTSGALVECAIAKNATGAGDIGAKALVSDLTAARSDGWVTAKLDTGPVYLAAGEYVESWIYAAGAGGTVRGTSNERSSFSGNLIGVTTGVIPGPWVPLPMTANWSGTSSPDPAPQYRKQLDGLIVMRGLPVLTGAGYTATMGTLPAAQGLRPAKPERFVVPTFAAGGAGSWGAAYISVNVDGTISHNVQIAGTTPGAAGSWVSLAGVNFPGES